MKRKPGTCWYCGSESLTDRGDCEVCDNCGATQGTLPRPGAAPVTYDPGVRGGGKGQGELPRYRPSGVTTRRAARARGDELGGRK